MIESLKKPKIFYGWWIVVAGFLTIFMSVGIGGYARSVFYEAMFSDLGWSRGDLALAMSVGVILSAVTQPFVGAWVDKHGASRLIAISAFLTGGCLILAGQIHALWQAFIVFLFLTMSHFGLGWIPFLTMVSNWFVEKRGRAIGITMAGAGTGGILSPLSAYVISNLGWRMAWVVLGLLMWVVVIPPALLVMKQKPELVGLLPDGKAPEDRKTLSETKEAKGDPPRSDKWALKGVLRMPVFWFIAVLHPLFYFGFGSIIMHSFALFTDKGISAMTAGTMAGIIALFSIIGKLVLGYLSDRIPMKYVMMGALALAAVAISLLFLVGPTWIVWLFVVLFGFSGCALVALLPILVGSCFNMAIIGRMLGIFAMFTSLASLLGPPFMGYSFDITGNYNLALFVFIICFIVSLPLVFFACPKLGTITREF
ncbi:L-lactate transporter [subsurface metagenome]